MTDFERFLKRLVPKPVPPDLRHRVIVSAFEARNNKAMTPGRRAAFAVCVVVLTVVLTADSLIMRRESASLTARLDGRSFVLTFEDEALFIGEILGIAGDQNTMAARARMATAAYLRQDVVRQRREASKRLKGWLEHESLADLN